MHINLQVRRSLASNVKHSYPGQKVSFWGKESKAKVATDAIPARIPAKTPKLVDNSRISAPRMFNSLGRSQLPTPSNPLPWKIFNFAGTALRPPQAVCSTKICSGIFWQSWAAELNILIHQTMAALQAGVRGEVKGVWHPVEG